MTTTSDASSTASDASSTDSDDGRKRGATVLSGPDESGETGATENGAIADGETASEETGDGASGESTDESGDSSSLFDKLDTVGTVVWTGFLVAIVVYALIPVVGLAAGYAPFDPPATTPYFALVGFAFLGAAALVGGAILDV
ncbi:hypothetical protein M0R88_01865 [Halorussus gelatinilyticus]|uniref:Uncharacterized protein n=1 Tax=Halorussus gelatinilyticus TaxID=2937524 RepID=A0A8U0IJN2_9EURY|nr:hypothetical protein [Halorussus gelatinilyticus]UPW00861.1 hypothetical protein M0R88_01865 [Halorussus gelatinilyticus]